MSNNIAKQESQFRVGFFQTNPFEQKKQLIKLLETRLAGIYYRYEDSELDEFKEQYPIDAELKLVREVDNEHDEFAVQVFGKNDELLGYISKYKNETIARLMDAGKKLVIIVLDDSNLEKDIRFAPTEQGLYVAVFMEE